MYLPNFFDYLSKEKNFSKNTVVAYKNDLETFKLFCLDQYEISDISKVAYPIIRDWIINLSEKNLSPLTINRKISSLSKYYDFFGLNHKDHKTFFRYKRGQLIYHLYYRNF